MDFKVGDEVVFVDGRAFSKNVCLEPDAYHRVGVGTVHKVIGADGGAFISVEPETPCGTTCFEKRFVLKSEWDFEKKSSKKKISWKFEMEGNSDICFTVEAPTKKQAFEEFVRYIGYKFVG